MHPLPAVRVRLGRTPYASSTGPVGGTDGATVQAAGLPGRHSRPAGPTLPTWPPTQAGLAPPPRLPIKRKVRVGVVVAAIIAGMLVLMGIINDIEDGLHDLDETSQQ
jgi:hypothetical protein